MNTFKVGDLVVGNENNGYGVTDDKALLRVTEVNDSEGTFSAELINHKEKKFSKVKGEIVEDLGISDFHIASIDEQAAFEPAKKEKKEKATDTYKFRSKLMIKTYADGRIESSFNATRGMIVETDEARLKGINKIIDAAQGKTKDELMQFNFPKMVEDDPDLKVFEDCIGNAAVEAGLGKLINFFKEFTFEPSFRMVNNLAFKCEESMDEGKNYIMNYFRVAGNQKADAVCEKMKSPEFDDIINRVSLKVPSSRINKRLKVYFGSQGTGKTTLGMEEADGRCTLCNGGILPSDMLEDFNFNDGKPGFQGSLLRKCMEDGKPIVLDEFNLLPFETVRFLQGVLDGKKQFVYKGETIKVKDGFEIIATMNLTVGGMVFGLPEPLVDRCYDIKEFVLTAKNLMSALE